MKNKIISCFLAVTVLFSCVPVNAVVTGKPKSHNTNVDIYKICNVQTVVPFRAGPGAQYDIVDKLPKDTEVYMIKNGSPWAQIKTMNEITGYVGSKYVTYSRSAESFKDTNDVVDVSDSMYTYDEMMEDIQKLKELYPNKFLVGCIGHTELGRDITSICIGNFQAKKQIFIQGGTHAREYMTSQLVMKQIEYYLQNYDNGYYNGKSLKEIFKTTAIFFVPMVNPDGISLSQLGLDSIKDANKRKVLEPKLISMLNTITKDEVSASDKSDDDKFQTKSTLGSTNKSNIQQNYDFSLWKANINGVDIHYNFYDKTNYDPLKKYSTFKKWPSAPSSEYYIGPSGESEKETKAIADYVRKHNFAISIDYHAKGSVQFWNYQQTGDRLVKNRQLAASLSSYLGYTDSKGINLPIGFNGWYINNFDGFGVIIEIGRDIWNGKKISCPLPIEQFPDIWLRNKLIPIYLSTQS